MTLRLLADDLTGALDSAAGFVPLLGPVTAGWSEAGAEPPFALDSATREADPAGAAQAVARLAPMFRPAPGALTFFKVDSLLRGHAGAELAALLREVPFEHVIIAPAIPHQGRITRAGRQWVRAGADWSLTGEDIAASLTRAGFAVAARRPGEPVPAGVSLWDCETDEDLSALARRGLAALGAVLWVGAAGLAAALGRALGAPAAEPARLPAGPLLALIGTDHPVMTAQRARCPGHHVALSRDPAAAPVVRMLAERGAAVVNCDLPAGLDRDGARHEIARRFATLCAGIARPGLLFVSGGETLRALCRDLGARGLVVTGEMEPGVPLSSLLGGPWDGLAVLSKSGAFGAPDFLQALIARAAQPRGDT